MNYLGKHKYKELAPCRACCMYGGQRMVTETSPEKFFVVCRVCGFKTKPHKTQAAATAEWNWRRNKET